MLRCFAALPFMVLIGLLASARPAAADVDRIEVLERTILAGGKTFGNVGPYERIRGRLYLAIEAGAAENQSITDIRLAPRDAQGRVTFATDFILLKPLDAARANGRLLYDANHRGDLTLLSRFNDASAANLPLSVADTGNGFLMEQGYTLLSTGWSWDVAPGDARLRADRKRRRKAHLWTRKRRNRRDAADEQRTPYCACLGRLRTARSRRRQRHADSARHRAWRTHSYPAQQMVLGYTADGRAVYDPAIITLEGGFKPGAIYAVTYTARGPRVSGLGLAGVHDTLLFFRGERSDRYGTPNPLTTGGGALPTAVIAVGTAHSARLLQSMVYSGLAADGRGRMAFDGALLSDPGAGRGGFKHRFAQPGRAFGPDVDLDSATDRFPFSTSTQTDPVNNKTGSMLDRANGLNAVPKLFYVNSATEYWARGASLTHTAVDGSADIAPDRRARIYLIAGGARHLIPAPERDNLLAHCRNPLDYRPLLRALLLHLDSWVMLKKDPPPSFMPTIADGTLGKLSQYLETFPKFSGLRAPTRSLEVPRLDFGARLTTDGIIDILPPRIGKPFTTLLPISDADGLDKAGIRLPEISVPLGTYTGWNPQNAATGAPERLARDEGSFLPFEPNENERLAASDPRVSIAERYPTRDAYTKAYAAATLALAERELILGSDVDPMIERAGTLFDRIIKREPGDESCAYLKR